MNINVLTPERQLYTGSITSVSVPGVEGRFQLLRDHAPIVGALSEGPVVIERAGGQQIAFTIRRGIVEANDNEIALLVQGVEDFAEPAPAV